MAFRLTSRPLAEVHLELHCEGAETVVGLPVWQHPEELAPGTQDRGVTVKPSDWQMEQTLMLRFTGTENLEDGAFDESGTFCLQLLAEP